MEQRPEYAGDVPAPAARGLAWSAVDLWRLFGGAAARHSRAIEALGDQALVSLTSFLTGVVVARSCSREEFGLYALGVVVAAGAVELQSNLLSIPYSVQRQRLDREEARRYAGSSLMLQATFSLLTAAILRVAASAGHQVTPGLSHVLAVLSLTVACVLLKEHLRRLCFASMHMRRAAVLDGSVGAVQVGALLLFAATGRLSATTALAIAGLSSALVAAPWLWWQRREFSLSTVGIAGTARRVWSLGRWMSASGVVAVLTNQLYPWLLAGLHGTGATAVWAASASITAVANPAIFAMCNYLAPAAARSCVVGGSPRLRRTIFKVSLLYASAATTFCLLVMAFGARAVGLVYGAGYGKHWTVVSLLALTLIPAGLSGIASRGLFALERPDADFLVGLLSLAIALGCSLWLTRLFGVTGAALSLLITSTANAVGRYWLFLGLSGREKRHAAQPREIPA